MWKGASETTTVHNCPHQIMATFIDAEAERDNAHSH